MLILCQWTVYNSVASGLLPLFYLFGQNAYILAVQVHPQIGQIGHGINDVPPYPGDTSPFSFCHFGSKCASLVAQLVKNLPAMQETWVQSLSWEDPLEKGKATHSSILAREFHGLYSP